MQDRAESQDLGPLEAGIRFRAGTRISRVFSVVKTSGRVDRTPMAEPRTIYEKPRSFIRRIINI